MREFPEEVFLDVDGEDNDEYFLVNETLADCCNGSNVGQKRLIGRYVLAETLEVSTEVKFKTIENHIKK